MAEPAVSGTRIRIRHADLDDPRDASSVARLLGEYLLRTEQEKAQHGLAAPSDAVTDLPDAYRTEAEDPRQAHSGSTVLLATAGGADGAIDVGGIDVGAIDIGVVVVKPHPDGRELKRFWVDPSARGRGAGGLLLDAALLEPGQVLLSVWEWREPALRSYRRRGFVQAPSWETRPQLVCLIRPGDTV